MFGNQKNERKSVCITVNGEEQYDSRAGTARVVYGRPAPAGHSVFGTGKDRRDNAGRQEQRTVALGLSPGLEFATFINARCSSERRASGWTARTASCLQHGDASSCGG